jgi:hypothetical protein
LLKKCQQCKTIKSTMAFSRNGTRHRSKCNGCRSANRRTTR